jgi:hypothetical protein
MSIRDRLLDYYEPEQVDAWAASGVIDFGHSAFWDNRAYAIWWGLKRDFCGDAVVKQGEDFTAVLHDDEETFRLTWRG